MKDLIKLYDKEPYQCDDLLLYMAKRINPDVTVWGCYFLTNLNIQIFKCFICNKDVLCEKFSNFEDEAEIYYPSANYIDYIKVHGVTHLLKNNLLPFL